MLVNGEREGSMGPCRGCRAGGFAWCSLVLSRRAPVPPRSWEGGLVTIHPQPCKGATPLRFPLQEGIFS